MGTFIPGKIIGTFTTEKGNKVTIRYPRWEDLDEMTAYINELSKEDTFITFSGETISKEEEAKFLGGCFAQMELGGRVHIIAEIHGTFAGIAGVERNMAGRKRELHIGIFGISIRKKYRGEGIGEQLMRATLEEAKKQIPDLRIIILHVYGINDVAKALYKKVGFKECGSVSGGILYRGDYVDDIMMYMST